MPAPFTRTCTPATPFPRKLTTARITPCFPTVNVRDWIVKLGQTAGGGLNGATTNVGSSARLFAVFVSASAATTVATFRIVPGCNGRTTIVIVTVALITIVPNEQFTTRPFELEHEPCVDDDDRYVTDSGNESATVTFVAVLGPLFNTRTV